MAGGECFLEEAVLTMMMRPYAGESDLQPIVDLLNECEAVDRQDEGISVGELRMEFSSPSFDPARDVGLWQDGEGRLVGFGQLWVPRAGEQQDVSLWFKVHPDSRGGDLETEIIAWGLGRAREIERERGVPVSFRSGARDIDTDRQALLERHGFSVVRHFLRLARPLDEPVPEPQFPAGFTLRYVTDEEAERWVAMYNESFVDHWNFHPWTVEVFKHRVSAAYYRPELNLLAVAPDGTFAAFDWCEINPEENERSGENEGWIGILGTRRGFRKIGLGRAMLLAGLQLLKANGVDTAKLNVDAANPTGALRLYESVGFHKAYAWIAYVKER